MNQLAKPCRLMLLLMAGLACVVSTPTASMEDPVGSSVAATRTAQSGLPPADTPPEPTAEQTGTLATVESACPPFSPGRQILPLPAGVAAGLDGVVRLKNIHNDLLATRMTLDMTFMRSGMVHLAGNLAMGAAHIPIAYLTLEGGGYLRSNTDDFLADVMPAAHAVSLTGAEGNSFLVLVNLDLGNSSTNQVYAGNLDEISASQPVLAWVPPQGAHIGNAIQPLAVRLDGETAEGFWFTYTMVGIGDLIFPPYNGLFYFDLASAESTEFLPATDALGGISPDQTMVAYGAGQGGTPGRIEGGLTIRNLLSCQETYIPFNPASNLGGGEMVFSPDNQFVAWTEAGGPSNMDASLRIRVARTDGTGLFDAPIANMTSLLGGEAPDSLRPVGWIADHLLVLEAYLEVVHRNVVIVWAPDPAQPLNPVLGANQSVPIADGAFLGFMYP
jgi:hypothetical protein